MSRISVLPAIPYPGLVLALCVTVTFTMALLSQGMGVIFPFIQKDLDISRAQIGLIASGQFIGSASVVLFTGWLADVIGVRRMRTVSILGVAVGLLFLSQIQSVVQGMLAAGLIGIAVSGNGPANAKAIMDWVAPRVRAMAMGASEASIPVSGIVAALALTLLAVTFGWRVALMVIAAAIASSGLLFFAFYRDKPGSYASEDKTVNPLGKVPQVLRNRNIWITAVAGTAIGVMHLVLIAYLVLYLKDDLTMSSAKAGGLLAVLMAGGAVGRLGCGMASDLLLGGSRVGLLIIVNLLSVVSMALMALLPLDAPLPLVAALVFAVGAITLGRSSVYVVLLAELAGPDLTGTTMGLNSTISHVAGIAIVPLFGLLADQTGTYAMSWWMMAAFSGLGVLLLAFVRPQAGRR